MKHLFISCTFCLLISNVLMSQKPANNNSNRKSERLTGGSFTYTDCGCKGSIELTIYNGLYGDYGGQEVPDSDEETKGAVTIANKNDTDGDGNEDKMDNNVIATANGRDEVDLMKLQITKIGTFLPECTSFKLKLTGKIKLWQNSTKGSLAPLEYNPAILGNITTLWVEAFETSSSVGDISIKGYLIYDDGENQIEDLQDEVKATAIWVEPINNGNNGKYTNRSPNPDPSSLGLDESCLNHLINNIFSSVDGTKYGLGTNTNFNEPPIPGPCGLQAWVGGCSTTDNSIYQGLDGSYGGRILIGFNIYPSLSISELSNLNITFDITRQIQKEDGKLTYGSGKWTITNKAFPNEDELADDDDNAFDEDNIPNGNKIFSFDNPANVHYLNAYYGYIAFHKRILEFKEFVRVSFKNDINLLSNTNGVYGSRCSSKVNWNLSYYLKSDNIAGVSQSHTPCHQFMTSFNSSKSNSHPRKLNNSTSDGYFFVSLLSSAYTCAYIFKYNEASTCWNVKKNEASGQVYLGDFTSVPNSIPKMWIIKDGNNTETVILENSSLPFKNNDTYIYNVLSENPIYSFN